MHDSDAMQRGYRYFKQLEAERRGYAYVRDTIAEFLINRRWELGKRDQTYAVALHLVDALMNAGALALYQCGVDVENSGAIKEQKVRKARQQREAELDEAAQRARDDERRRVERRLVELEQERELERYAAHNRRELERAEQEEAKRAEAEAAAKKVAQLPPRLESVKPQRGRRRAATTR